MSVPAGREKRGRPRGYVEDWRPQRKTTELLDQVRGVLDEYAGHLPLSVRQVFYRLVATADYPKDERAYGRLCETLVMARRARIIPFYAIRDDGVDRIGGGGYGGVEHFHRETARRARSYRRDRQEGQPCRLEVWCEAAGMVEQLARVAEPYSVPVCSAGGFASVTAIREIAQRALDRPVPTVLLHVGDFDPSGESIFTAIAEDAAAFVAADREPETHAIEPVRVALAAEQVDAYDLPTAPAKKSDSRSKGWHGGTCQLEALAPDQLAAIVRDAIESRIDPDFYESVLAQEREDRAELLALPPRSEA